MATPTRRASGLGRPLALALKFAVFRAGAAIVPHIPIRVAYLVADQAGTMAWLVSRGVRAAVEDNLRRVPTLESRPERIGGTTRRVFQSVARYYVDLLGSTAFDVHALRRRRVRAEGLGHLHAALERGRGVILASAHYGCPEIPLQAARAWGLQFLLLTEPLEPPQLSELFVRLRAAHGHQTLPVGFHTLKETLRTLRRGGIVLLLVDRDIQGNGIAVPFFGADIVVPTGAVELARASGAPLIPVLSRRQPGGGAVVALQPELRLVDTGQRRGDLRTNVAALLQRFEPQIRADPGQWLVLQRLWGGPVDRSG